MATLRTGLTRSFAACCIAALVPAMALAESKPKPPKLHATAILIETVDAGDVSIPAEFRLAIYERLIQKVRMDGAFQKVYRSGDRDAKAVPDLVVLRTTVDKFKQGNQLQRELTTVTGGTTVTVTTTVTAPDGKVVLTNDLSGKVRFFGENLGVTNDMAKRISKVLFESYGPNTPH